MPKTVYVAAPMSGVAQYNVPAIEAAGEDLRKRGLRVLLPADLNNRRHRAALLASTDGLTLGTGKSWGYWLGLDIPLVADRCDAVVVLPGWQHSRGARLETFVAFLCGKPILHYPTLRPVRRTSLVRAWLGEWAYLLAKVRIR